MKKRSATKFLSLLLSMTIMLSCAGIGGGEYGHATITNTTEGSSGESITLPVHEAEYVAGKGYKFGLPLAAKEASDTITARVFDGQGKSLTITADHSGEDYTETGVQYTLMRYFDWLEKNGKKEEKPLGAAARDYCAAAQI